MDGTTSAEDLRRIDALYPPIPLFAEWAGLAGDSPALAAEVERLQARRSAARPGDVRAAADVAMRAAAVDTGALEGLYETDRGFTMSVALQSAAAEIGFAQRSPEVPKLIAAHVAAFELVLDAVTRSLPVTEAWIRRLHEVVTGPQATYSVLTSQGEQFQPLPRGEYKRHPNHVRQADGTVFAYAPVDQVPAEMSRLVAELTGDGFAAASPVLQAAYAHHAFVRIHPFADGNGRVARALASVFTYRAYGVPLLVFADQRDDYLAALRAADQGRPQVCVDFLRYCLLTALRLVVERLAAESPVAAVAALEAADDLGLGIGAVATKAALRRIAELLEYHVGQHLDQVPVSGLTFHHYRTGGPDRTGVALQYQGTVGATRVEGGVSTDLAINPDGAPEQAFEITVVGDQQYLDLRDVHPELSTSARMRLSGLAERMVATAVSDAVHQATDRGR